jgi:hypothetical protein
MEGKNTTANSTYKKLAVQWLNEALCFVSSSVVADSFPPFPHKSFRVAVKNKKTPIAQNHIPHHKQILKNTSIHKTFFSHLLLLVYL